MLDDKEREARVNEALAKLNAMIANIERAAESARVIDNYYDHSNTIEHEQGIS